jgi:hypothetical protein
MTTRREASRDIGICQPIVKTNAAREGTVWCEVWAISQEKRQWAQFTGAPFPQNNSFEKVPGASTNTPFSRAALSLFPHTKSCNMFQTRSDALIEMRTYPGKASKILFTRHLHQTFNRLI